MSSRWHGIPSWALSRLGFKQTMTWLPFVNFEKIGLGEQMMTWMLLVSLEQIELGVHIFGIRGTPDLQRYHGLQASDWLLLEHTKQLLRRLVEDCFRILSI